MADEIVGAVLGAVLGAALAGYLTYVVTVRATRLANRRALTVKLYEDWHGDQMLKARIVANTLLKSNPDLSFTQLHNRLEAADRMDDWTQPSHSVHFSNYWEHSWVSNSWMRNFSAFVRQVRNLLAHRILDASTERSRREDGPIQSGWSLAVEGLNPPPEP